MKKAGIAPVTVSLYMGKWLLITVIVSLFMGSLSAFFLTSLEVVTKLRVENSWLLIGLPFSGALFAFLYKQYGATAIKGNNLVLEQANGGEEEIPLLMLPLTLFGTITTHLFGGSVGREGTAVQMGGAIASAVGKVFCLEKEEREIVIIAGISAGFSSVFGTPLAGTIFGLEVLALGRLRVEAIFPSFFAALFANFVTESFGIAHTHYELGMIPSWTVSLFLKLFIAGICFGLMGWLFSRSIVFVKKIYSHYFEDPVLRTFVGGAAVVLLAVVLQNSRYLGLSLPLLKEAFEGSGQLFDSLGKLVFTALSLGAGFQGGEVTPLFEIGASLGSTLALVLQLSVPFLAGLGFIGVFSGATNTPIACFIMGIELFGSEAAVFFFMICVISYMCSGNSGIYSAQKIEVEKGNASFPIWSKIKKMKRKSLK